MEAAIKSDNFPNNNYGELLDKKSVAHLLIVHELTKNHEINHPKSIYLHKPKNGKFAFGPVWDFDWAFGGDNEE